MRKKLSFILFISVLAFFFIPQVFAQAIIYPIRELGNCTNATTCKVYCDQSENRDACIAFAKLNGLYKSEVHKKQLEALSLAKTELGCNAISSCRELCSQETNLARCQAFAQKHELYSQTQPPTQAAANELLQMAKEKLDCDSEETCFELCNEQANYTKCAALTQNQISQEDREMFNKYKSQFQAVLGCDSIPTCMAFCMNPLNMPKCMDFGKQMGFDDTSTQSSPAETPEVWCPKISSECNWDGKDCVCNGKETCSQTPGCSWDGRQCNCPGTTTQTQYSNYQQEPGEVWCPKAGAYCAWDGSSCTCWGQCVKEGGTWNGSRCDFPVPTAEPPEVWCPRNPGCTWTEGTCQCKSVEAPLVQGAATSTNLLEQIFNFFLRL